MASLLDHALISQRYFFPRQASLEGAFTVDCGAVRLACYHHRPHPGARTLVHFHGNGEVVADYLGGFLECIEQLGLNCFLGRIPWLRCIHGRAGFGADVARCRGDRR